MKYVEPLTGDALEARIKELEAERDKLLAETPFVRYAPRKTSHGHIKNVYNMKIGHLRKHGVEHNWNRTEVKQKCVATKEARYGSKAGNIKQTIATKVARYGSSYGDKEHIRQTNMERYGYPQGPVDVQCATKERLYGHRCIPDYVAAMQTRRQKYGEHLELIVEKSQQTKLERWGDAGWTNPHKAIATKREIYGERLAPIVAKAQQTCRLRYGSVWPHRDKDEWLAAISKTCMERYGVPWFCMTNKCMQANGQIISAPNRWWQSYIEEHLDVHFEFEHGVSITSYDLYYGNLLIDINPTHTHNSVYGFKRNTAEAKQPNYHWWKQQLAIAHGYTPLMIFDWHDPEIVLHVIEAHLNDAFIDCTDNALNPFVVDECTIKKHWVNTKSGEHLLDESFADGEMLDAGFVPVYDCGHWSYDS